MPDVGPQGESNSEFSWNDLVLTVSICMPR